MIKYISHPWAKPLQGNGKALASLLSGQIETMEWIEIVYITHNKYHLYL